MKNVLYLDADFAATLLVNEEQTGNTITLVIDADDTAEQELLVTLGTVTESFEITASTENEILLEPALWNYGDVTVFVLNKGETACDPIYIKFPEAIDTDASLYQTSEAHYSMQGGNSIQAQIINIQTEIGDLFSQVIDYIHPSAVIQDPIADGGNNTALTFEFYDNIEGETVSFNTCFQFQIATSVDDQTDTYGDATLTATLAKDGVTVVTDVNTYGDGKKTLMLNYLLENMAKGNHTFTLNLALSGGSLSQLQFISAYIMAMASIDDGNYSEDYEMEINSDFADFMEDSDQEVVGEFIELSVPTGGSGNGQNFSGNQFCEDWLSAFVRPIEYAEIFNDLYGDSSLTFPDTSNANDWSGYLGVSDSSIIIPTEIDNDVYENTGKHVNMWFASFNSRTISNAYGLVKMIGCYVPESGISWKIASNSPTQGYASFEWSPQGNVYIPTWIYALPATCGRGWTTSNTWGEAKFYMRANNIILVYNVEAFKTYLRTLSENDLSAMLDHPFILAECNIKKEKHQTSGMTDWSDNDDYSGSGT